eukprot:gene13227-27989_t
MNFYLFLLQYLGIFFSCGIAVEISKNSVVNVVGVFTPFNASSDLDIDGVHSLSAFAMALREINGRNDILPNHHIKFILQSSIGFYDTIKIAMENQINGFNGTGIDAFISGVPLPETSAINQLVNDKFKKVLITTEVRSVQFSPKENNLYKVRTIAADSYHGMALQDLVYTTFKYRKVTIFYSLDDISARSSIEFIDQTYGSLQLLSSHSFQLDATDFTNHINAAKIAGSQIFIVLTDARTGGVLLEQGYNMGLFKEGTQIFGSEQMTAGHPWKYMSKDADVPAIMKGYIGPIFDPSFHLHDSQEGKDFVSKFRSQKATVTVNSDGTETCDESKDDDGHYLYREQTQTHSGPGQRVRC